jgi:5-methyltetrahydropteroyltriglutamate--homocysteine methyltransferase
VNAAAFRAETVGSLLRPAYLKEARAAAQAGTLGEPELRAIEDRAVDEAIALPEEVGLDVVTDGEMRRATFMAQLYEGTDGVELAPGARMHWTDPAGRQMVWHIPVCVTGRLARTRSLSAEEFVYARDRATRPVKQALPSPLVTWAAWLPDRSRDAYPDPFDLFADATELVRQEARAVAELGCTYIQVDAPEIPGWVDPSMRPSYEALGIEIDRLLTEGLDLINAVADGIDGVAFGIHLCKGNNVGYYYSSEDYTRLSRHLFGRLTNYEVFLLEYDDERSGGFEPLADCPDDKMVVLGLVSSKLPALETPEALTARVEEAARYHPRDRLALSPQCGFASVMEGNPVDEGIQRAKLELVASVAHSLWS